MTIDKAIEAMEDERANIPVIPHSKLRNAHLLGIEALKQEQRVRRLHGNPKDWLLPGETDE